MTEPVAWGVMLRHLEPYLKASMETTRHAVIVGHLNS